MVAAAVPRGLRVLVGQRTPGATRVIAVGPHGRDPRGLAIGKDAAGAPAARGVLPVGFVPLTGAH